MLTTAQRPLPVQLARTRIDPWATTWVETSRGVRPVHRLVPVEASRVVVVVARPRVRVPVPAGQVVAWAAMLDGDVAWWGDPPGRGEGPPVLTVARVVTLLELVLVHGPRVWPPPVGMTARSPALLLG